MVALRPNLCVRFDNQKVDEYAYGAWRVFWSVVSPEEIKGVHLFGGDSLRFGEGSVYCIGIHSNDPQLLRKIKDAFSRNSAFKNVAASRMFTEGDQAASEPLTTRGQVNNDADLVGPADAARTALGQVRRGVRQQADLTPERSSPPHRSTPASQRTANLPALSSYSDFKSLLDTRFKPTEYEYAKYWLTPEELCDLTEKYCDLFEVQWHESSNAVSEDFLRITLFWKDHPPSGTEFHGLFPHASAADATRLLVEEYADVPAYSRILPQLAGIQGKLQLNFSGEEQQGLLFYDKGLGISATQLWPRLSARRGALLGRGAKVT